MKKNPSTFYIKGGGIMENKGIDNLIPITERTEEEQRAMRIKAGQASGKARRRKRELKTLLELYLSQPNKDNPDIDNYTGITIAQVNKALSGDTKAYEVIRDTIGQKPVDKTEITTNTINVKIEE